MEYVDICLLIPDNLPLVIGVFIIVVTMVEVNRVFMITDPLPQKIMNFIILVTMVKKEVDPGLKRPTNLPLELSEQELMLTGEVDIGTIPATLNPTIQVAMVVC